MPQKLSVYLDDSSYRKLGDIKRALEHGPLLEISISKAVSYAILRAWQVDFVDGLNCYPEETRQVVEKYAPAIADGGNEGGEQ